jgi:hypothetical protein
MNKFLKSFGGAHEGRALNTEVEYMSVNHAKQ